VDTADDQATLNLGTIHALITGSDWIKGGFFVSAITDLAWQYSRNLVGETDTTGIGRRLDELANTFFQRTDDDPLVSRSAFFTFSPLDTGQRSLLNFDHSILGQHNDEGFSIINTYHQNFSDIQGSLLDSFFGDRLTRFPVADSQVDKVKLTLAVLGEGLVTSDDNAVAIDTGIAESTSNVASVFYDPADDTAVILTAVPTDDTEILSWQGCDLVSEDGTQCTVQMRTDHLVTLSFGYKETLLNDTFQLVDLSEETVVVSQDGITLDVTLTSGNLADLDSLGQGDVVVSSSGNGFLRRIVVIDKQADDHYILTTEDVALEEVISQGTGTLFKEMTHGDLAEPLATNRTPSSLTGVDTVDGVRMLPGESPDDRVFRFVVGDQTSGDRMPMDEAGGELTYIDPDSGIELTLKGTIDVTIDIETGVSIKWLKMQDFTFIPRMTAEQSLEISVGGEWKTPKDSLLEKKLASFTFNPIVFFVGVVPVVVVPQVDLVIGIEGKVGAKVYTKISFNQNVRAGVVYNRNAGVKIVEEFSLSHDFTRPTINGYAQALPFIKTSPSMMVYGLEGPDLFLKGLLKLKGETETPIFGDEACSTGVFASLHAGMDAGFEWKLKTLKKVLGDWTDNLELSVDLYKKEWLLRKWNVAGDCIEPPFLEVKGLDIRSTVQYGSKDQISQQYTLKNSGEETLDWEIGLIEDGAISVSSRSGTLAQDETTVVTVSIDPGKLSRGIYRNTLQFKNQYDAGQMAGYVSGTTSRQVQIDVSNGSQLPPISGISTWNWDSASGEACYHNRHNEYCNMTLDADVKQFWTEHAAYKTAFYGFTNQLCQALFRDNRIVTSGYTYDAGYHRLVGKYHAGMDIDAALNDAVYSPIDGTVLEIITTQGENNRLKIKETGSNRMWIFAHITPDAGLKKNDQVTAGITRIGQIRSYPDGEHLHLEVHTATITWWGINSDPKIILDNTISPMQAYYEYLYGSQSSSVSGECGAFVAPGVWKQFDCYNLAAIGKITGADPFTPSWELIGGYWQWGRKGPDPSVWHTTNTPQFAHGPTGPDAGEANEGEINGWDQTYAPDDAWSDSHKTSNDPCPAGFRVPTQAQWDGVLNNNSQSTVGTWSNDWYDYTNYSAARFFGSDLMLPAAGNRLSNSGALYCRGNYGSYWSSSESSSSNLAWSLYFDSGHAYTYYGDRYRRYGFSVRCISE
jgi:uncharacterized protein (TIGR02145 family)